MLTDCEGFWPLCSLIVEASGHTYSLIVKVSGHHTH